MTFKTLRHKEFPELFGIINLDLHGDDYDISASSVPHLLADTCTLDLLKGYWQKLSPTVVDRLKEWDLVEVELVIN
jgi:hypothetical protein